MAGTYDCRAGLAPGNSLVRRYCVDPWPSYNRPVVIGREGELAAIDRLLDVARGGGSGALVIRGEAGSGKTTLLDYAVARAADATVLRALGVPTESEFAFSGLHDLLYPLRDRIDDLPLVQAAALRGALALAEAQGVGRLYIGAAILSLLAAASDEHLVVCVVDDAHWLDQASADALTFAARRLEAEGVAVLFAARDPFDATGIAELQISGLSAEDAAALVASHAGHPVAPDVAERLAAATDGNPLALVDLARHLTPAQLNGAELLPHPLPLEGPLEAEFAARASDLSDEARRALIVAATADTRALRVITRVDSASRSAIEECERAGLLDVADGQVTFTHPLVRSSVYQRATAGERREAHLQLAHAFSVDDRYSDRRAWHAVAALLGPDEAAASDLEAEAEKARARRGHVTAAAMFERAAKATPASAPRARRFHRAARSAWLSGQPERASLLLDEAVGGDELVRADNCLLRVQIEHGRGVAVHVAELVDAAETVEPFDRDRAARLLAAASALPGAPARVLALRAAALANGSAGPAALLAAFAVARCGDPEEVAAAVADAASLLADPELRKDPELLLAACDAFAAIDGAVDVRELLALAARSARTHSLVALPRALLHEAWLDFAAGRWTDAYLGFSESSRLAEETGQPAGRTAARAGVALLDALQGREVEARGGAAELGQETPDAQRILGLLELGLARGEAADHLTRAAGPPVHLLRGLPPVEVDLVEARLRNGITEGVGGDSPWLRGLRGDAAAFVEARGLVTSQPFLAARVQLNHGEVLRRAGDRRAARDELRAALELFDGLGARPWAERTEQELRASGERARRRQPSTVDELTAQELQVARIIAGGASYKEAATMLFLSPKTIEFHLGKVYRKLGIASRRQLAQRLSSEGLVESA